MLHRFRCIGVPWVRRSEVGYENVNLSDIYVVFVVGTRAQLIKVAPVITEVAKRGHDYRVVFTGQHVETMDRLAEDFGLKPVTDRLYTGREITGVLQMALWFIGVMVRGVARRRRGWLCGHDRVSTTLLVHGDTASTLAGALIGRLLGLRVAHVESGLRSFKWLDPFPEELIRVAVLRLAHLAFAPGEWAARNVKNSRIRVCDTKFNTILDSLRMVLERPEDMPPKEPFALVSIHRFENLAEEKRFVTIVDAVLSLSCQIAVRFVLHPVTRRRLCETGLMSRLEQCSNVQLLPRMIYSEFIRYAWTASLVLTDGGSNQEELALMGKPTVLVRKVTERQEGIGSTVIFWDFSTPLEKYLEEDTSGSSEPSKAQPVLPEGAPAELICDFLISESSRTPA